MDGLLASMGIAGRRKSHNPAKTGDALALLIEEFSALSAGGATAASASAQEKRAEILTQMQKRIEELRAIFFGDDAETEPKAEECQTTATILMEKGVLLTLADRLFPEIPFESRKHVSNIFCYLAESDTCGFGMIYLKAHVSIVSTLVARFENPEMAIHCSAMLRSCIKYEHLHKEFLKDDMKLLDKFFQKDLIATDSFDVVSEAFGTFSEIFTHHKKSVAAFIGRNYAGFFERYNKLILSESYITQRQSLKILSDMLLDASKTFQDVMLRYIDDKENLKIIMTVMRVDSLPLQLECFHIFKLFVANPHKSDSVKQILFKNREKLIPYLEGLMPDKKSSGDQAQFEQEKILLIETLKALTG